jgi:predicted acylesterase/phospholipase RssA
MTKTLCGLQRQPKPPTKEKALNAPLSKPLINLSGASHVKMALIAEGGDQRGIFTAGVLDAWLENDFDPFDLFIGTSSGSQNITSFLSRQKGYAKRLICGLSRRKRFYPYEAAKDIYSILACA